jgi:catechol 2,3-dioxygenase-like lactoylglutathione lyase family enzyme
MSRVQLALTVADLEASIDFYSKLFGATPAKRRPGYANFAIAEPPLKLVLLEGEQGQPTVMDHLGVEVESTGQVTEATSRLAGQGLATQTEEDTACCYALQDKVWVNGPGSEPWEVYVVKADRRPGQGARQRVLPARGRQRQQGRAGLLLRKVSLGDDAWAAGQA